MDNITINKKKTLKCDLAIKLLSLIALVCTVISCTTDFFYYNPKEINGKYVYELVVRPLYFWELISLLLTLAPIVLLILYIFKFYNKLKATIIVPIIFGLFPLKIIFNFLFRYSRSYGVFLLIDLLIFATSILAIISALEGFNKKIFIIIPMSVCLLNEALSLIRMFSRFHFYIEDSMYLYLFKNLFGIIGDSCLYVALLLFGLKNKIPSMILLSPEKEKKNADKMSPEQALKLLKDKLDLDMITEEEYQAQRTEIISKL